MKMAAKSKARKKRYKVRVIKDGEPKTRHINYVWATSAREAEQIIRDKKREIGEKILKVKAGALL